MNQNRKPLLLLFGIWLFSITCQAQSLSLPQITQKIEEARAGVEDLQAKASFGFQLRVGIIPYSETLYGKYLFQKPDRHKLDFPTAPSYLKSVPSMFSWALPSTEKYEAKVSGPTLWGPGGRIYQLVFTPRNPSSQTSHIKVIVDAEHWRVARQETSYRDGGSVLLSFNYLEGSQYPLLEKVTGTIDIPGYKLKGNAMLTLSEHRVNEGLEPTVFPTP